MSAISLPYPPSANRLWAFVRGRPIKTAIAKHWQQQTALTARCAGVRPIASEPVAVDITLHPKETKAGVASKARIDLDNAIKAALDGLNGVAYADDKQVVRLSAEIGDPIPGGGLTVSVSVAAAKNYTYLGQADLFAAKGDKHAL